MTHSYNIIGGHSLLKTKNEDQGFEIIKEVPPASMPRMGTPFFGSSAGLLPGSNSNLSSLAALMTGSSMSSMNNMSSLISGAAGGAMGGLMSQSNMLQKCK